MAHPATERAKIPSWDARKMATQLEYMRAVSVARRVIERAAKASETGQDQAEMAGIFMPLRMGDSCPIRAQNRAEYENLPASMRRKMFAVLDGNCGLCGDPIVNVRSVTYDHVLPRALGGGNYANIIPAHSECNGKKANRFPTGCELIVLAVVNARLGEGPNIAQKLGQRATLADIWPQRPIRSR